MRLPAAETCANPAVRVWYGMPNRTVPDKKASVATSAEQTGSVQIKIGDYGLRGEALSPMETLAQSVSTIAPTSTPAATIPLVAALAGCWPFRLVLGNDMYAVVEATAVAGTTTHRAQSRPALAENRA